MPATLLPALLAIILPDGAAPTYVKLVQPSLLLICCALSVWVSLMYRGELRRVFLYLAAFLLLYGLVSITPLVYRAEELLKGEFLTALVAYQVFTYLMLLMACVFILRVIGVSRLNRVGLMVFGLTLALGAIIVATEAPDFAREFEGARLATLLRMLTRIFDVLVLLMLVPVVWLYAQNARAKYQESASFTVIVVGIIASLILVYFYEILKGESLAMIAALEFQKGSVLDALYIWGYLIIALGLFAHRKHQEWSFKSMEDLLE